MTDRFDALGRGNPAPMGFATRAPAAAPPSMLLIGTAPAANVGMYADVKGVDAILLTGADKLAVDTGPLSALKGKLWGASVGDIDFEGLGRLQDAGCDFIVPSAGDPSAAIMRDDDMSRGFEVDTSLSEDLARALDLMPIDFLVLTPPPGIWPLKLSGLIKLEGTISLIGRHFAIRMEQPPTADQLEIVRDLPVDALLIDLASSSADDLKRYRELINAMPPRKPRAGGGDHAVGAVSQTGTMSNSHQHDGNDDDDDDDDDWDD
ncbi:MAG: hypothetical protein O3C10_10555 [Chloroflexi bacterium]|nr:hypothetical protein [Chloroflexota bacterium]